MANTEIAEIGRFLPLLEQVIYGEITLLPANKVFKLLNWLAPRDVLFTN